MRFNWPNYAKPLMRMCVWGEREKNDNGSKNMKKECGFETGLE